MSGGSDKTSYRASVNYHDNQGIMINTGFKQLNGRINISQKALNDKLTIDLNLGATEKDRQLGFTDAFKYATIYNPTAPIRSTDAAYTQYDGYFQQVLFDYANPVMIAEKDKNEAKNRLLDLSLKGSYEIVKGLVVDASYSTETSGNLQGQYYDKNDVYVGNSRTGLANRTEDNSVSRLFESTVHYLGDVTPDININAVAGYSYQDFTYEGFHAEGGNFLTDDFSFNNLSAALDFKNGKGTITSYKNSNKLIGFVGRLNLNIKSMYFISASARYEGSSRFGSANKWGLFPALSGGVDLSKLIDVSFIDNLKIRANYGVTGNQPIDSYLSILRLGPSGNFFYNGAFVPSYSPTSNANPDLKWERTGQFDAGLDFSLFKSTLSGTFDFYTKTTTDLLWPFEVPVPPNLFTTAEVNIGKLRSSGIELTLNYNVIKKGDFNYAVTLTPSYNLENTLVSLSGTYNGSKLTYGQKDLSDMGSPGQNQVPLTRVEEGKPIGQLLALVFNGIDEAGNMTFVDENKDGTIDQADRRVIANGLPKFLMGFGNVLAYKNWDLNVFFRGVFGHHLVNSFRGFYEVPDMITSYNLPKTAADMRNPTTKTLLNVSSGTLSSKDIENASFVSLDNLSLGYNFTLPKTSQFSKIRLYLAGNNLFYITKYKGVDPNPRYVDSATDMGTYNSPLVPGIDRRNTWFRTRSITFGANFVF
jgi:iron complex outermembrane receptor protein